MTITLYGKAEPLLFCNPDLHEVVRFTGGLAQCHNCPGI